MPSGAPLAAPDPGDPDRKRVLNVLAQRRYRQRKKEKKVALEGRSQAPSTSASSSTKVSGGQSDDLQAGTSEQRPLGSDIELFGAWSNASPNVSNASEIEVDLNYFVSPDNTLTFGDDFMPQVVHSSSGTPETYAPAPPLAPDANMDMPILKLLQSFANMAQAIGCMDLLFKHDASITWTMPQRTLPGLSENMQPTPAQLSIPHHPIFDILPWPSVRTKLIFTFSLPEAQRPQVARSSTALIKLAYDVEDEKDGFRINGEGREGGDWEIGELFFKNWWWALDKDVVDRSNAWRRRRGQRNLGIESA